MALVPEFISVLRDIRDRIYPSMQIIQNETTDVANSLPEIFTVKDNILNINTVASNMDNVNTNSESILDINKNAKNIDNIIALSQAIAGGSNTDVLDIKSLTMTNTNGNILKFGISDSLLNNVEVLYFNTVDELSGAYGTIGTIAVVSDLDRGGNFKWESNGTQDGGTVFSGTTGYWKRQYDGAINVKWFRAVGDGIADDSTAIQNALDTGRTIFFPAGTYKCNSELLITKRNTSIIMELGNDGDTTTSIKSYASTGFGVRFSTTDGDIDGCLWTNVRITQNGIGSGAVDIGQLSYATFINCSFSTAGKIGQEALRVRGDDSGSGAYYNTFIGCTFSCTGSAFKSLNSYAVRLYETTLGATPNSNTFISCRLSGGAVGLRISGNNNCFYSPYLESNSITAVQFVASADNTRCLDNIVMNPRIEGSLTTSVFSFGVLARNNRIYGGHVTSFAPATLIADSSDGSNSWDLNSEIYRGNIIESYKISNLMEITSTTVSFESDRITTDSGNMHFVTGQGSPEGTIDAPKGSIWTNQGASSASTLLYVKTTNEGTLTGWVAK